MLVTAIHAKVCGVSLFQPHARRASPPGRDAAGRKKGMGTHRTRLGSLVVSPRRAHVVVVYAVSKDEYRSDDDSIDDHHHTVDDHHRSVDDHHNVDDDDYRRAPKPEASVVPGFVLMGDIISTAFDQLTGEGLPFVGTPKRKREPGETNAYTRKQDSSLFGIVEKLGQLYGLGIYKQVDEEILDNDPGLNQLLVSPGSSISQLFTQDKWVSTKPLTPNPKP